MRGKPLSGDVELESVAKVTVGFSGADIANLANEAALTAARHSRKKITADDFSEAFERIVLGTQAPPLSNENERRVTAYHEAGHALAAALTPGADPPYKVTIVPRGQSGGVTVFQPEDDRRLYSKDFLTGMMVVGLGGRAAEEVAIGEISSGASNDLRQVTNIARRMVAQLGMSPASACSTSATRSISRSSATRSRRDAATVKKRSAKIDAEVRRLVEEAHEKSLTSCATTATSWKRWRRSCWRTNRWIASACSKLQACRIGRSFRTIRWSTAISRLTTKHPSRPKTATPARSPSRNAPLSTAPHQHHSNSPDPRRGCF